MHPCRKGLSLLHNPITHPAASAAVVVVTNAIQIGCWKSAVCNKVVSLFWDVLFEEKKKTLIDL